MAENTIDIAGASQDFQTIEDFVNLPAGSDVRPRLLPSVNVGTLAGTRQAIFEAGGLPATPFATKALMTASVLVDGDYAQVTDDTVNNGLYIKTAGAWVKSAYDPTAVSNTYTDNKVKGVTNNFKTKALMTASSLANDSYAMVTEDTEANNGRYSKVAGVWVKSAYNPLTISKEYTDSSFSSFVQKKQTEQVLINPITGRYINIYSPEDNIVILSGGTKRQIIKFNVSDATEFEVINSTGYIDFYWVFADANEKYVSMTKNTNPNGVFSVPENAVWAFRTYQMADYDRFESPDLKIIKTLKLMLSTAVKRIMLDEKILYSTKTEPISYNVRDGYSAEEVAGRPAFISPNSFDERKYIVIDATRYNSVTVSGSSDVRLSKWVIENKDGSKVVLDAPKGNNDTFVFPDNALRAYRTVFYHKDGSYTFDDTVSLVIEGEIRRYPLVDAIEDNAKELAKLSHFIGDDNLSEKALPFDDDDLKYMQDLSVRIYPSEFEGANQTQRMKNAIDFVKTQGFGIIELGYDTVDDTNVWAFTEAILIPSNCWIYINNVTVKKANGVFDNLFRNDGLVPNPDPYGFALELNRNENIRIIGNDPTKSIIEGNADNPHIAPSPTGGDPVAWIGDYYGWRALTVLFANTHNFRVYNLTVQKTNSWAILNEQGCSNFKYHDIVFNTTVKNGDGINAHMGCNNFEIYNISGRTSDDMIGLKSKLNYIASYPHKEYFYPKLAGGYSDRGFGTSLSYGKIWNIHTSRAATAALLLYSGGGKIHNISISNVTDKSKEYFVHYVVRIGNMSNRYGAAPAMGDCYNITLRNISSYKNGNIIELVSPLKDAWLINIKRMTSVTDPVIARILNYSGENIKESNIGNTPD